MSNILFAWNDTIPCRRSNSKLIVILNDQNTIVRGVKEAFFKYKTKVIRGSERNQDENLSLLSA